MRQIEFIENGTVIDHIKPGEALNVLNILKLKVDDKLMIGSHFESNRIGKKDIVKISNKFLTQTELNRLSLIAPNATVSIIKDNQVQEKFDLKLEEQIDDVIKCFNSTCMTNNENMKTRFITKMKLGKLKFKCAYCEKSIEKENLIFK